MATVIEKFVAEVGWDIDPKGLSEFNKQAESVLKWGKRIAGAVTTAIGAFTALATVTNKQTAENAALAASVGLTAESLDAWAGIARQAGFEADNIVDLVEEMNNKLGELKGLNEMTSAQEALKLLGLEFKNIKDLEPEKQFQTILETAKELEDTQVAVSAVDMLMGGEANKILGFLRTYDMTLEEILQRQKDLNMLTEEGREGAIKWNMIFNDARTIVGSLTAQFSGLMGEALAPIVNEFIQWVITNRELIKSGMREWIDSIISGLKFMLFVAKGVKSAIDQFGGLRNVLKLTAIAFASLKIVALTRAISAMTAGLKASAVASTLLQKGFMSLKAIGPAGIIALGILAIQDLYTTLKGGKSAFEPIHNAIADFLAEDVAGFIGGILGIEKEMVNLSVAEFWYELEILFTKTLPAAWDTFINYLGMGIEFLIGDFSAFVEKVEFYVNKVKNFFSDLGISGSRESTRYTGSIGGNVAVTPTMGGTRTTNVTNAPRVTVSPRINVTQQPGESGENLANRVVKTLNQQAAQAMRNNDTGIVY